MTTLFRNIKKIIWALIGAIVIWMTIASGNSSVRMDYNERSYIVHDNLYIQLLVSVIFLSLLVISSYLWTERKKHTEKDDSGKLYIVIRNIVLITITIAGFIFVLTVQREPYADQYIIVDCANSLRNGDFSPLDPDGYLGTYHNQFGIVLVLYYLSFIFGNYNYVALQCLNVFPLAITYWAISSIVESKFGRKSAVFFLLLSFLFFPPILYLTFIYGNIIGLMFCALAALFFLRYTDTMKWRYLWLTGLMSFCAIWVKQNYLIFTIGLLAWAFFEMINDLRIKTAIPLLLIAAALVAGSVMPMKAMEKISSKSFTEGVSAWSFIAMGLQNNDQLYDGWWNHYHTDVYESVGNNTEELNRISKAYIKKRTKEFLDHPKEGINFFARKNVSQWLNPDFQGFWINWKMKDPNPKLREIKWIENIFSLSFTEKAFIFLNLLQFIVLLGTAIYVIGAKKSNVSLYFAIIFLGGAIFHTFWEAKGQYTLPYYIYLFPLASKGWIDLSERGIHALAAIRRDGIKNSFKSMISNVNAKRCILLICCLVFLVMIQSHKSATLDRLFAFDQYRDADFQKFCIDNTFVSSDDK